MKCFVLFSLFFAFNAPAVAAAKAKANPLSMVLSLMDSLTAKLTKAGEDEDKAYNAYVEWCDDSSKNANFQIKTLTDKSAKLTASIDQLAADIQINDDKIGKLVADIEKDTRDLKDATLIREKEHADFASAEGELVEGVDTLGRAIGIIDRDMSKNPAAFAQLDTSNLESALKGLSAVFEAASFSTADKSRLAALVQSHSAADEQDLAFGAPAAAVYKSHSGGILDVLEDMKEKAEEELSTLRKEEMSAKSNYEMLAQSLNDSIKADTKDKNDETADQAANTEAKATAEGDLVNTKKDLAETSQSLESTNTACMQTATDHEASTRGRTEELKVLADVKKILVESSKGAVSESYGFVQLRMSTSTDLANAEVVQLIQQLAKQHHSNALVQLASKISAALRYGSADGGDVFAKIKGLISDMVTKLENEASADAEEKAYCDDQLAKTEAKKVELDDDIAKLTSKIDKNSAASAELKGEVKVLQADLASLAKEQAEMDRVREEEHATFVEAKTVLDQGLKGVGLALQKLREYYGGAGAAALLQSRGEQPAMPAMHGKAAGAGGGIIDILSVCESDFAKELALEEKTEADSQSEYDEVTQENSVIRTTKTQDVKYKSQEFIGRDKLISDLTSDKDTANTALSAVMEYYGKIKDRCIAKPESYEEIKARRTAEIAGLKQALAILEGESAFAQGRKRGFRNQLLAPSRA